MQPAAGHLKGLWSSSMERMGGGWFLITRYTGRVERMKIMVEMCPTAEVKMLVVGQSVCCRCVSVSLLSYEVPG